MNESQEGTGGVAPPPPGPEHPSPSPSPSPQWAPKPRANWDRKSAPLAIILSILMPGLGQVYLGFYQRGFMHAIIFGATIVVLASGAAHGMEPLFGIFLGFFYFYNVIDAGRRASFYNRALEGYESFELPQDFRMPGPRGSLLGGVILTIIGFLLFMHTRFGYDLDWLAEWWPIAIVAFGINLIYKATRKKDESA